MSRTEQGSPLVWVIIVNWQRGCDTVECIQSLIDNGEDCLAGIAVCDNASPDESMSFIRSYLEQRAIEFNEYAYVGEVFCAVVAKSNSDAIPSEPKVVLINTGANLGFAGGNNVGIRYATVRENCEYILLLNNDATIAPGCLRAMASRFKHDQNIGLVGCTILDAQARDRVQAVGGASFKAWLARGDVIGRGTAADDIRCPKDVERRLDYIHGAALMIKRECVERVGLMEERYFLYYEEIDWAIRAKRCGFLLGYAESAVVFHKGGATIGSNEVESERSLLSEYYLVRSAILFTRKFYPYFVPTVLIFLLMKVCRTFIRGDLKRAKTKMRAIVDGVA